LQKAKAGIPGVFFSCLRYTYTTVIQTGQGSS